MCGEDSISESYLVKQICRENTLEKIIDRTVTQVIIKNEVIIVGGVV